MPVEVYYGEYHVDASGGRRVYRYASTPVAQSCGVEIISYDPRIDSLADMRTPSGITKRLFYKAAADSPEVRTPFNDESLSSPYVPPVNPYPSTTAQYQPTAPGKSEPLPCSAADHDDDTPCAPLFYEQLDTNLPAEAGVEEVPETAPRQNKPQLTKRPSEEEVIGHNWIKFHGAEQSHASPNDSPSQMTTLQERNAPSDSRRAVLRSTLRNIGEKLRGSGSYKGNKLVKQQQDRVSRIFDF